jgi:hypothetical protein
MHEMPHTQLDGKRFILESRACGRLIRFARALEEKPATGTALQHLLNRDQVLDGFPFLEQLVDGGVDLTLGEFVYGNALHNFP